MNNKTERFSYKYGYGMICIEAFTSWAIDKQLQVISKKMLFTTIMKKLKNKAALS